MKLALIDCDSKCYLLQRGWTPLIMAAKGGYTEVVDILLEREPHINATDQVSHELCSRKGSSKLSLLEHAQSVSTPPPQSPSW